MLTRTLCIIKPDAVSRNIIEDINKYIRKSDISIIAKKKLHLSRQQVEAFYAVHSQMPFFKDLCDFMVSGPVLVQVLEGHDVVSKYREIMGATDPTKAESGTIRADFADSIDKNCVHGSDSPQNAITEIEFFFSRSDLI